VSISILVEQTLSFELKSLADIRLDGKLMDPRQSEAKMTERKNNSEQ